MAQHCLNAFSSEYLDALQQRDEPESGFSLDPGPVELREAGGRYALFRTWQKPEAGDTPLATFATRVDGQLFLAAHSVLARARAYVLKDAEAGPGEGFPVEREGRIAGHLHVFDPDWAFTAHVLASMVRSPEDLAKVLAVVGPSGQQELGAILGRGLYAGEEKTAG